MTSAEVLSSQADTGWRHIDARPNTDTERTNILLHVLDEEGLDVRPVVVGLHVINSTVQAQTTTTSLEPLQRGAGGVQGQLRRRFARTGECP